MNLEKIWGCIKDISDIITAFIHPIKLHLKHKDRTICSKPDEERVKNHLDFVVESMNFNDSQKSYSYKQMSTNLLKTNSKFYLNRGVKFPYSTMGLVKKLTNIGDVVCGTGTLIGENVVFVHNLYDNEKTKPTLYNFIIEMENYTLRTKIIDCYFPKKLEESDSNKCAILILNENFGKYFGFMGIVYNHKENHSHKFFTYDVKNQSKIKTKHEVSEKNAIDTQLAQSESGLWFEDNGEYFIYGVNNIKNDNVIYITNEFFMKIEASIIESKIKSIINIICESLNSFLNLNYIKL